MAKNDYKGFACAVSSLVTWSQIVVAFVFGILIVYLGLSWHRSMIVEERRRRRENEESLPKCLVHLTRVCIVTCLIVNLCVIIFSSMLCLFPHVHFPSGNHEMFQYIVFSVTGICYMGGSISVLYIFFLRLKYSLANSVFEYNTKTYKLFQASLIIIVICGIGVILTFRTNESGSTRSNDTFFRTYIYRN